MASEEEKYPEGHFVGLWMGLGIAIFGGVGIPLCVATGTYGLIGIGPALGVGVGIAIGQAVENKYSKANRIRPLTDAERKKRKLQAIVGVALLLVGILAMLLLLFLT